jgi:Golgi apparatus protein 1
MSDISSDWQVDPVLQKSCQRVVESSSCSKYPQNRVLDCLMTLLASESGAEANVMTDDCEETLIQIQYFLARDFPMDSLLFEECKLDAQKICGANPDWIEDPKNMEPEKGPLVLSCLFRNVAGDDPTKIVSPKCAERVRDTMRQRALSVHLLPDIEDSCMEDLADLCSDKTKPGEELQCLQNHLEDLDKDCRKAITNFTELEMKNPVVDPFIWRHCREYIEDKCSGDKSEDEDDVLECLIELKSEMKNKKCKVSVEHLQLLKIKEIRFTPKFKSQCQSDVVRYCNGKDMQPLTSWKVYFPIIFYNLIVSSTLSEF